MNIVNTRMEAVWRQVDVRSGCKPRVPVHQRMALFANMLTSNQTVCFWFQLWIASCHPAHIWLETPQPHGTWKHVTHTACCDEICIGSSLRGFWAVHSWREIIIIAATVSIRTRLKYIRLIFRIYTAYFRVFAPLQCAN